jgi:hypothetical protein
MLGFGHAPPGLDALSMAGIHGLVKLLDKCQRLTHSSRMFCSWVKAGGGGECGVMSFPVACSDEHDWHRGRQQAPKLPFPG